MAIGLVQEFAGATVDQYDQIIKSAVSVLEASPTFVNPTSIYFAFPARRA